MALQETDDNSLTGSPNTDVPNVVGKVVTLDPRKANPNCPDHRQHRDASSCHKRLQPVRWVNSATPIVNSSMAQGSATRISAFQRGPTSGSRWGFEIRAEFFNIFNHTQFKNPQR